MKILHAADLHLCTSFSALKKEQREKMRQWQRKIPGRLLEISRQNQCNLWLLSGDIFDGNAAYSDVTALQKVFRECGVPVMIAPGNHDSFTSQSPWVQYQWPENVHIFGSEELRAVEMPELECRVWGAAFTSMDSPSVLEGFHLERRYKHELCIMHGDPVNNNSPYNPVSSAQVKVSGFDYIALGHIHNRGCYQSGNTVCAWPGCPMGRGWDEQGEKGIYICDISDRVNLRFQKLLLPGFYEFEVTDANELDTILPSVSNDDFFRVKIRGRETIEIKELYARFSHLRHLELMDCTVSSADPWEEIQDNTFRGVFFRILHDEFESADEIEKEIITLAAQISQDILSGMEVDLS